MNHFVTIVTDHLLTTLNYEDVLEQIANCSIPFFADGCVVDIKNENGKIERLLTKHVDKNCEILLKDIKDKFTLNDDSPSPSVRVMLSGIPELKINVDYAHIKTISPNEAHAQKAMSLNVHSYIAVPLETRGRRFGTLSFFLNSDRRPFDESDLEIAIQVSQRAALAIDNAKLYRDAQAAVALRDNFISMASHELKSPIHSLQLQTKVASRILESRSINKDDVQVLIKSAENSMLQVQRLNHLVDDILDLTKISEGSIVSSKVKTDLSKLCLDIVERYKSNQVNLVSSIQNNIYIDCDYARISQAIKNIMDNAIKFGLKKPIEFKLGMDEEAAIISIKDRGIGINMEDQKRIFNQFERAIAADDGHGLGLGLYISHQVINAHLGTIEVESSPNEGSTFFIRLPFYSSN